MRTTNGREARISAKQTEPSEWTAQTSNGPRRMVPFVDVGDREYSTYLALS
jgi:hypothetical protein